MCYTISMDTQHGAGYNPTPAQDDSQDYGYSEYRQNQYSGHSQDEAQELFSHRIKGRRRVYFIDLKQSRNGKFVKISEKSNGQKRTILMDQEDFAEFYGALTKINELLQ